MPDEVDLFAGIRNDPSLASKSEPDLFADIRADPSLSSRYHRDRLAAAEQDNALSIAKKLGPNNEDWDTLRANADAEGAGYANAGAEDQANRARNVADAPRRHRDEAARLASMTAEERAAEEANRKFSGPDDRTLWQQTKDLGTATGMGARTGAYNAAAGIDTGLNAVGVVSDQTAQNMHDLANESARQSEPLGGAQGALSSSANFVAGTVGYLDPFLAPLVAGGESRRSVLAATGDNVLANGNQTKANIVGLASAIGAGAAGVGGRAVGGTIAKTAPSIVRQTAESAFAGTSFMAPRPIATAMVASDDQALQEQAKAGINGLPESIAAMTALGMAPGLAISGVQKVQGMRAQSRVDAQARSSADELAKMRANDAKNIVLWDAMQAKQDARSANADQVRALQAEESAKTQSLPPVEDVAPDAQPQAPRAVIEQLRNQEHAQQAGRDIDPQLRQVRQEEESTTQRDLAAIEDQARQDVARQETLQAKDAAVAEARVQREQEHADVQARMDELQGRLRQFDETAVDAPPVQVPKTPWEKAVAKRDAARNATDPVAELPSEAVIQRGVRERDYDAIDAIKDAGGIDMSKRDDGLVGLPPALKRSVKSRGQGAAIDVMARALLEEHGIGDGTPVTLSKIIRRANADRIRSANDSRHLAEQARADKNAAKIEQTAHDAAIASYRAGAGGGRAATVKNGPYLTKLEAGVVTALKAKHAELSAKQKSMRNEDVRNQKRADYFKSREQAPAATIEIQPHPQRPYVEPVREPAGALATVASETPADAIKSPANDSAKAYIDSLGLDPAEKSIAQDALVGWDSSLDPKGYKSNIDSVLQFTREKAARKKKKEESQQSAPERFPENAKSTIGNKPEVDASQEERGYTLPNDKPSAAKTKSTAGPAESSDRTVGVSNALSEETRQRFGLPSREVPDRRSFDEMYDAGKARAASDPRAIANLLDELRANPDRVVSNDSEIGMLVKHRVDMELDFDRLRADLEKARKAGDPNGELIAKSSLDSQRAAMVEFTELMERSGTAAGRSLVARKMMSAMDYSLAHMEATAESAKGAALSDKELADVQVLHEKLKAKNAALEEALRGASERAAKSEAHLEIERLRRESAERFASPAVSRLSKAADAARKRIKARGIQFNSGLDPIQLFDLSVIGAEHIAKGISSFAKWSAKMVTEFGEAIRPHLKPIFDASEKHLAGGGRSEPVGREPKTLKEKVQARVSDGAELTDLQPHLRSMALDIIRGGTVEREAIISKLYEQVAEFYHGATREQVRDALSGYGQRKMLDKGEAKVILREINAEAQKLAQLEALQKGNRPLATGMERQPLSNKARALQRLVNEAKRKAGISSSQGPEYTKSLLESAKTRARNQITDLQAEVDTGVRIVRGKATPLSDAELVSLKETLAAVRKVHEAAFSKPEITDEQRLQGAISAAKSVAEAWGKRLARAQAGDFSLNKKSPVSSLELSAIRARADSAKSAYAELKANDPAHQATVEARSNASYRARIADRMADLRDRMAVQDFATRPKKRLSLDAASLKAQTELETANREWKQALSAHEKAKRSTGRKIIDAIKDIPGQAKSIKASMDNSALLRQGWRVMFTNPVIWQRNARKTFSDAWKTLGGKPVMDEIRAEVRLSRYFNEAKKAKLAVSAHEEEFPVSLPSRIPVLGRLFTASEHAYTGFQYRNRLHVFEKMMDVAKAAGVDVTNANQLRSIGSLVNSLTGRADLGKFEPSANIANNFFFSPRKIAADWNFLTLHATDLSFSTFARKQALYNTIKAVSGTAMVLALANAALPGSVELDPKSPDFGKIKIGNTRYDVTGGTAPLLTLAARIFTGQTKNPTTGKISDLNDGKFGSTSKADVIGSFFGNKLSPIAATVRDHLRNKTFEGYAPTLKSDLTSLLVPMAITNFVELQHDTNATPATVSAGVLADFFGVGTNTYNGDKPNAKKNEGYWPRFTTNP